MHGWQAERDRHSEARLDTTLSSSPELPGHRSTLDDAHHLAAEPVLDHRSPRHQGEFVGVLDQRELAARELDSLREDALHRLAVAGGPKRAVIRRAICAPIDKTAGTARRRALRRSG